MIIPAPLRGDECVWALAQTTFQVLNNPYLMAKNIPAISTPFSTYRPLNKAIFYKKLWVYKPPRLLPLKGRNQFLYRPELICQMYNSNSRPLHKGKTNQSPGKISLVNKFFISWLIARDFPGWELY